MGDGKEDGNYYSILAPLRGYIGMIEKKVESTTIYWGLYRGCIGIMEKKGVI